jgi:hypothetical protein
MHKSALIFASLFCLALVAGCGPTEQEALWETETTKLWKLEDQWNAINRRNTSGNSDSSTPIAKELQSIDQQIVAQLEVARNAAKALPAPPSAPDTELAELAAEIAARKERIKALDAERQQIADAMSAPMPMGADPASRAAGAAAAMEARRAEAEKLVKLAQQRRPESLARDAAERRLALLTALYKSP